MTRINDQCGGINLSQGFPDFDEPPALLEALARTAIEGPHQYA
ncbi:MAG: aminotransferase, partial [Thermoleophilia bacterium]|nr:aminotransferase [Thermoleophilia bacterium]